MPIVVSWIGPDRTHRQQPVATEKQAKSLQKYLQEKGTPAEIKTVAYAPKW